MCERCAELAAALDKIYGIAYHGEGVMDRRRDCCREICNLILAIPDDPSAILARVRAEAKAEALEEIVDELREDARPKRGEYIVVGSAASANLIKEYADLYAERAMKYREEAAK